jgi:transcriptional antiterminator
MIYRVHLFQDVRLKILIAALAANASGDVAHDHQMYNSLLDHFSAAIAAIRVTIQDRPPLVSGHSTWAPLVYKR